MHKLSTSEKQLIIILMISIIFSSYLIFRYKSNDKNLAFLQEQLSSAQTPSDEPAPVPEKVTVSELTRQLNALQGKIDVQQKENDNRLIDITDNSKLANFRYQISLLAESNNLVLNRLQKENYQEANALSVTRPSFSLELKGSFYNIYAFIEGLDTLNHSVGILKYALQREKNTDIRSDSIVIKLSLVV